MKGETIVRDKKTFIIKEKPCFECGNKFECFFSSTVICGECQK